ncbi:hypothetical protein FDECE_18222 [Fusarium decemcellulare]|nr:hypothetical protein FDECE_18222 [Fusarium decemcellulare]
MSKILLTGGSGFIAAHILEQLVAQGHTVITTVRTQDKAQHILDKFASTNRVQTFIVPDMVREDAFDEVAQTPGLQAVFHTASPFHYNFTDPDRELVAPAVSGTVGILGALKRHAPTVKRVILTSSFAAMLDDKGLWDPTRTFDEESWNPDGVEALDRSPNTAYQVSKKLAERAAWDFMRDEKPAFDLVVVNPVLVLGPTAHYVPSSDAINTSNQRFVDLLKGKWRERIPETDDIQLWVDVRDAAKAHVVALEKPEAGGKRLLVTAGDFSHREIVQAVRSRFPEYAERLPGPEISGGARVPPEQRFKWNVEKTNQLLKIEYISLEQSVVDICSKLKEHGI